jgi:hypothetical protein
LAVLNSSSGSDLIGSSGDRSHHLRPLDYLHTAYEKLLDPELHEQSLKHVLSLLGKKKIIPKHNAFLPKTVTVIQS